jgi:hypothetical protein
VHGIPSGLLYHADIQPPAIGAAGDQIFAASGWLNMDSGELTKLPRIWPATVSRALVSVNAIGDTGRHDTHSSAHRERQIFETVQHLRWPGGTCAPEKPPVFGMIQRGGEVVVRMRANIPQVTSKSLIHTTRAPGTCLYTDAYDIYSRLEQRGTSRSASVTTQGKTLAMMLVTGCMKCTFIPWKACGLC